MSYYEDKAKDSEQQTMYLIWLMIAVLAAGALYCSYQWLTHKCPEQQQIESKE